VGARSHLPLALRQSKHALLFGLALLPGCADFDFLTPDFPERGAPAVFQANIYVDETGVFRLDGSLAPGLTADGFRRGVRSDTVRVSGLILTPGSIRSNGTRDYAFPAQVSDPSTFVRPIGIVVPTLTEIRAVPPIFQWYGLRRIDPDTVVATRGEDLVLRIANDQSLSQPAPQIRQWFLALSSIEGSFQLGGQNEPPDVIRVPSYWVPAAANGRITATLTYYVAGTYQPAPGDYLLILGVNMRMRWNIRLQD
jgi:hypothetical protein